MAAKKKAEEMTELDAPQIDTEEIAQEAPAGEGLEKENADLKKLMADMQKQMLAMQNQLAQQQELMLKMAAGKAEDKAPLTQTELDTINVKKLADEAAATGKDPWTVEAEVFVPHRDAGEDKFYWLSINDRTAQIPANDSRQVMKLPFALILVDTLAAKRREEAYMDNVQVYDPQLNPHQGKL